MLGGVQALHDIVLSAAICNHESDPVNSVYGIRKSDRANYRTAHLQYGCLSERYLNLAQDRNWGSCRSDESRCACAK